MKIIRNIILVLLCAVIIPCMFAACASGETDVPESSIPDQTEKKEYAVEVPESIIEDLVLENEYAELGKYTLSVTHHPDEEIHRDSVDIVLTIHATYADVISTCSAVYQFDRASDLWSLIRCDEWSEPTYQYNDNLVRTWNIDRFGNQYIIMITDIGSSEISAEFVIRETVYAGLYVGDYTWETFGRGTFELGNSSFEIPLELPDELFVSWMYTQSGENESTTDLYVSLSPESGISTAFISPEISVHEDKVLANNSPEPTKEYSTNLSEQDRLDASYCGRWTTMADDGYETILDIDSEKITMLDSYDGKCEVFGPYSYHVYTDANYTYLEFYFEPDDMHMVFAFLNPDMMVYCYSDDDVEKSDDYVGHTPYGTAFLADQLQLWFFREDSGTTELPAELDYLYEFLEEKGISEYYYYENAQVIVISDDWYSPALAVTADGDITGMAEIALIGNDYPDSECIRAKGNFLITAEYY